MRLAICDDEALQLDILEAAISECPIFKVKPLSIERFLSVKDLIQSVRANARYDFIFLDIHMPEKNGLDAYRETALSPNTKVIFVSTHIENLPEVFALRSPHFLCKPYNGDTFYRTVRTAIDIHNHEYLFSCTHNEKRHIISSRHIRYIEVYGHELKAHADKVFSLKRSSLNDLGKQLMPYGFFRCHRSYLINLDYYINHSAVSVKMMGSKEEITIPLGREGKSKIDGAILRYKTSGVYHEY